MNWTRYFDRIYILHHLPQKDKLPRLTAELKRVGILDSGIAEWRYTTASPYDKLIWDSQKCPEAPKPSFVNICLEVRKCLGEAVAFGYKRILLLENDVCFLKDLNELEAAIADTPSGYGIVQYDKFVNDVSLADYKDRLANRMVNSRYFNGNGGFYTSAACVGLFDKGISEMLKVMDEHICATDIAYQKMHCRYAVAAKNLAVQVFYGGSYSVDAEGIAYMHQVYKNAGVNYADYAVPKGYGFGKVLGVAPEPFKVSVYAIALNEERFAKRWYECFKEADEICVLDTGSTDKTVEILRSLGAKVTVAHFDRWKDLKEYDELTAAGKRPWRFDQARNEAMALCSKESTLFFCSDMDDVIEPGWKKRLERIWKRGIEEGMKTGHAPNSVIFTYGVVYGEGTNEKKQTFQRHSIHTPTGWHWIYRCHEILESTGTPKNFIIAPQFRMESRPEPKDHSSYLHLLEADAREESTDGRVIHLLAREYMQLKRYDEAIVTFMRHLSYPRADWNCERAASMKFIADCYAFKGNKQMQEYWLWKAMTEDPKDRDASYVLGRLLLAKKDYKLAQKVLERCVAIEKPNNDFPFFSLDSWTEQPWLRLAEAYFYDGKYTSALAVAEKAYKLFPTAPLTAKTVAEIKAALSKAKSDEIIPCFRIELG